MPITIRKVENKADLKAFIRYNYEFYKENPYSVPDLYEDMLVTFNRKKNAAFDFCEADYFLAYNEQGELVGRTAAIINQQANKKWEIAAVRFGWIDFVDDPAVSKALLDTVVQWGRERGMTCMQGPLGFTDLDAEGCLIEGFDQLSTMGSLYNYAYYAEHFTAYGLEKEADWVEFKIYIPQEGIPAKHQRIADIVQKKYNLNVLKYTSGKKLVKDYGRKIFELINESYANLYGFSPITERQIDQYVKTYLPVLDLRMVTLITESDGTLIGVGISMPSMSRALQKAKGKLFPFGWFHLLKALKGSHQGHCLDLLLVGIRPDYQSKGVNALLFTNLIPVYKEMGFLFAESNPELEQNEKVQAQWEYFTTEQHKRRRAFRKTI